MDELYCELRTLRTIVGGGGGRGCVGGERCLDTVFQEAVTPRTLNTLNSASGQGQEDVATSEAAGGIQEVGLQESQSLNLSNRFEISAPFVDGNGYCKEDEQTDNGTVVQ